MTDSTIEKLSVDETSVMTYAFNVTSRGSRWKVSKVRGDNVVVPGRHGAIYVPDKKFEENELVLNMWVLGAEEDGSVPTGMTQRQKVRDNANKLLKLFTQRNRLVRMAQVLAGGDTVETYAECLEAVDFTTEAGGTRAEMSFAMRMPDPFWQDTSDITYSSSTGLTVDVQLQLTQFDAATAPMDDLKVVVSGPATNPRVTVLATGAYVQYNGTLASGTDWRIDSATWQSVTGVGIGFTGAGTNAITDTVYVGANRFVSLPPALQAGQNMLQLGGSGFGAGTQLKVKGRRKFLIG